MQHNAIQNERFFRKSMARKAAFGLFVLATFSAGYLIGIEARTDKQNETASYGSLGLPNNCRAYVQISINGMRSRDFTIAEGLSGLERNCGAFGALWKKD